MNLIPLFQSSKAFPSVFQPFDQKANTSFQRIGFWLGLALLLLTGPLLQAQTKYTVSGQLKDASNGEDVPFATIQVKEQPGVGTTSNVYGFYSLTLPAGNYTLVFSFIGYASVEKPIKLTQDLKLSVELSASQETLKEVVISAEKENENVSRNEGSVTTINMQDVKEIPTLCGEPDVLRVAQMSPGIKTAGEGNSGFYVRGGGLDQNLVLIDEAPVYNPSHVLGFFSVFNGDAIKGATLYKGGMMPEYGGKTASVMDVRMKDGNSKNFGVSGGIGLIASRLTVEGPIVKDKGSFLISGRRSFVEPYLSLSGQESIQNSSLSFYDLNLKASYKITDKDKIYLSGYFGRDNMGFEDQFGINWGNATGTFRWNHLVNDKLFSNTTLIYSNYNYNIALGSDEERRSIESSIEDYNVKQTFSYYPNSKNSIKFGANVIHHTMEPGSIEGGSSSGVSDNQAELAYGLESALFIQNEQKISGVFSLNYGLRFSLFNRLGSGTAYTFDEEGKYLSETYYGSGKTMQTYANLEPRLSATYLLNEYNSVKLNYNRNAQYLHQLTSSTTSTPVDVWVMSSNNIKPQIADQVALGYFRNLRKLPIEVSAEVYYKYMQNTIDYRTGANTFLNDQVEGELVYGTGESYGLEVTVKKTKGKFTGWLGYTLSKTTRQFDEINNGEEFRARQDRTHDINVVAMYELNKKLTLSGAFIFYTGDAVTFPTGEYTVEGNTIPYYTERNGYRMPNYHRMDLGLTWKLKKTEKFQSDLNFSLYNVYGRENAYSISFQENEDNPEITEPVQLSLFRWVPSITYNFKF
ncbi:TonB-dependent receptor [bacterium SCSIO 12741]|nr:TonB-dependent receptor [bacterium SCSIO 12741]